MVDKLPDTWQSRDFPVLVELVRMMDAKGGRIDAQRLSKPLALDDAQIQSALRALQRRGLIEVVNEGSLGDRHRIDIVDDVSGAAYVLTGLHPDSDDTVTRLIEAIDQAIARVDPDERTRLRRLRDSVGEVGRDTLAAVIAATVTGAAGI